MPYEVSMVGSVWRQKTTVGMQGLSNKKGLSELRQTARTSHRLTIRGEKMGKYIWMAVTADKYELPIAISDTARELGEMFGVTAKTVVSSAFRNESGLVNGFKYVKVENDA